MLFYIPFKPESPKTRLSRLLSPDERVEFSFCMLDDVYSAVEESGHDPVVLTTHRLDGYEPGFDLGYETRLCPEPLTPAVNSVLDEAPVGVVMSDVCIATPDSVLRLVERGGDTDLSLAPGRNGGTNAFVSWTSEFEVDYHGTSYIDHLETARSRGIDTSTVDSFRLSTDVDEPDDLIEVLLHGEGMSHDYIADRFEVVENDERRVDLRRLDDGG